jgi:DNA-binding beta-propeller fold protein YncE
VLGKSWITPASPLLCAVLALSAPALASAATAPAPSATALGTLSQLQGASGCLVDRSGPSGGCARVRALHGPAPFLGSRAIAISPDGRSVYVASSRSNAVAAFRRDVASGRLTQPTGTAGCIAARGASGCAKAAGLTGPSSVAVSADGRSVYAAAVATGAVVTFRRNRSTGSLSQAGCVAARATPGCALGRALDGADVVTVSADGGSVYAGAFTGNAVAVFTRSTSTGALTQPADATGCIVNTPVSGCTSGLALGSPEGMAISADGTSVYVASAASNALAILQRTPATGALAQATDGSGCIADAALAGCTTGTQLAGANAVAISPDDGDVYVTSLISNTVTAFTRTPATGALAQQSGTSACVIYVLAVGCSLGRALSQPEGLAVSPDGASLYATAFGSDAVDVLQRNTTSGAVIQKARSAGCVTSGAPADCARGRALNGVSSVAVSPDGRHVYAAAFASNAVSVFKRVTRTGGKR